MNNSDIIKSFARLSTSVIADASVKLNVPIRYGPSDIVPFFKNSKIAGIITPIKHDGSISSVLEALEVSEEGNILYIDNQGRTDEAVIGDLITLEAKQAGISGIIVWGFHRDSSGLSNIDLPIFSTGRLPVGPRRSSDNFNNSNKSVFLGEFEVFSTDVMFADTDGIIVVAASHVKQILEEALKIQKTEQKQIERLINGLSLRKQFHFSDYQLMKKMKENYSFRKHLQQIGGSIET